MGRLTSNKGFLLVDTCIAMLAIAVMTMLYLPCTEFGDKEEYTFADAYLEVQSRAMAERQGQELGDGTLSFNEKGNVDRAMTVQKGNHDIVIELGGGRLVYQ